MRKSVKFQFNTFESEGKYDYIQIEFDAILVGDVDANKIQSNGQPQIKGNIKARELVFTGFGYVEGNCDVKSLELLSRTIIKGNIKADRANIDGKLECYGDMEVDRLEINGTVDIKGNLKCNKIYGKGNLIVNNIIVNTIDFETSNLTNIKKIQGDKVKLVGKENTGMFNKLFSKDKIAYVAEIDGDRVSLSNIKSDKVFCSKLSLGENCDIAKKIRKQYEQV